MELLFKGIKQNITSRFITEASDQFIIDETILTNLADSIIAGIFGVLLFKSDTPVTEKMLTDFVSQIAENEEIELCLFDEQADFSKIETATRWKDTLLMEKDQEFFSLLSQTSGVDEAYVEKLTVNISYALALYLGRKLMTEEYTITGLLGQIYAERNFFLGYIPFGLASVLGLPSLLSLGKNLSSDAKVISDMVYYEIMHGNTPSRKGKSRWFKWLSFRAAL